MNLPDLSWIEEKQEFLYIWEYVRNIFWLRCMDINKEWVSSMYNNV